MARGEDSLRRPGPSGQAGPRIPFGTQSREPAGFWRNRLALAPLFPVAVGLIAGIALDDAVPQPPWVYAALFALAACGIFIRGKPVGLTPILVGLAACSTGGACNRARCTSAAPSPLAALATEDGRILRVFGRVVSPPQPLPIPSQPFAAWTRSATRTAFLLDVDSVEGFEGPVPVAGRLRVIVGEQHSQLHENDLVEAFGRLYSLTPPRNPGAFDWATYQRKQGIAATLRCERRLNVRVLDGPPAGFLRTAMTAIRSHIRGWLTDDLATGTPDDVGLLEALVLGHRATIDRKLNDAFLKTGCGHFLAASGTNVAILCSFVWAVSRLLRLTDRGMLWLMIGAIVINAIVADPRPPILRATVMGLLLCVSFLLRRPAVHLNTLSLAAILLLLWDPQMLFDAGFQLSFAAVVGVVYLAPALLNGWSTARGWIDERCRGRTFAAENRRLIRQIRCDGLQPGHARWRFVYKLADWVALAAATAMAAWLATLPIGLHYFRQFQPWGPINTLLIFPTVCISTWMGYAKTAIAALFPTVAALLAGPLRAMEDLLREMVDWLALLPGSSMPVASPPWWLSAGFSLALLLYLLWFVPRRNQDEDTSDLAPRSECSRQTYVARWIPTACALTLAGVAAGTAVWLSPSPPAHALQLTVLPVGTGLATVIELPTGAAVLFDAGSASAHDVGRSVIVPFLRDRSIRRVERIYLSHADYHHFTGVPTVLDEIDCGPVVVNRFFDPDRTNRPTEHLRRLLVEKGHPLRIMDPKLRQWNIGGAEFELLWPTVETEHPPTAANDASTVLRISYAGRSILLTGDIGESSMKRLAERRDLHADALVLPGQGAVSTTLRDFVAAVGPEAVVLSSRMRRRREPDPLVELAAPARLYNTGDVGAVQVTIAESGFSVSTPSHRSSSTD